MSSPALVGEEAASSDVRGQEPARGGSFAPGNEHAQEHEQREHEREREHAKAALVRTHLMAVWGFLRRLGLSPEDAEDAAQEVCVTAMKKFDSIFEGQERRFLFGIAVRIASHRRRSSKSFTSRAVDVDPDTCEAAQPTPSDIAERNEALALLDEALQSLNDEMRTAFVLYEIEEMTIPEIAAVVGIPVGTVASRLQRGREQFQKATRRLQMRQP